MTNYVLLQQRMLLRNCPPMVLEEHQHFSTALKLDDSAFGPLGRHLYPRLVGFYNCANAIRFVSEASRRDFVDRWGVRQDLTHVLLPPIDLEQITELGSQAVSHPWFDDDSIVVMGVGRLSKQKNFQALVRAFAAVKPTVRSRLILVGDGSERESLMRLAAQLGISEDVHFTGHVPNAMAWLNHATMLVLSSIWEGRPAVLSEAMQLRVPAIAFDCPSGPREMIQDGVTGLLVPPNNIEALTTALRRLMTDAALRRRLAAEAFARVQQLAPTIAVPAFEELLREVASRSQVEAGGRP